MPKLELPLNEGLYPVPVVLVSCRGKAGQKPNIITIAWCGVASSKPPTLSVSIRPSRYSHKLITEAGDFVVNIPTADMSDKCDLCGMRSGREIDKFEVLSFTETAASKISSPLIKECPVNIECKLRNVIKLGSHDMFIGEVVAIHADSDMMTEEGSLDYNKLKPFVYNQGEYWSLGKKIGYYGCSAK